MKTSLSDMDFYKDICQIFVNDDNAFAHFRTYGPDYNRVIEHVSQAQGQQYLISALGTYPRLIDNLDRVRKNDAVGRPAVYPYSNVGLFSPTTLRYAKVMADIYKHMGGFDIGKNVIEIGGGYGGQCRIINEFMNPETYTIIDLPIVNQLQEKYLSRFHTCPIEYVCDPTLEELKGKKFDFVISNWAFDELLPEYQEIYFETIIKNSKHGYLSGRYSADVVHPGHMTVDRFKDWCDIRPYDPSPFIECQIITW